MKINLYTAHTGLADVVYAHPPGNSHSMNDAINAHDTFIHIRIIIGMVLGISVSRLLVGLSRFMQHPEPGRVYWIHLGWVFFVLLYIIHFWWFEFSLIRIQTWTFAAYFFLIAYTSIFALLAAMLFPDHMGNYVGFRPYFQARQKWFYSALLALFCMDIIDTLLKGQEYYDAYYDWDYPVQQALFILGTLAAIVVKSERYQTIFISLALAFQIVWIASLFEFIR